MFAGVERPVEVSGREPRMAGGGRRIRSWSRISIVSYRWYRLDGSVAVDEGVAHAASRSAVPPGGSELSRARCDPARASGLTMSSAIDVAPRARSLVRERAARRGPRGSPLHGVGVLVDPDDLGARRRRRSGAAQTLSRRLALELLSEVARRHHRRDRIRLPRRIRRLPPEDAGAAALLLAASRAAPGLGAGRRRTAHDVVVVAGTNRLEREPPADARVWRSPRRCDALHRQGVALVVLGEEAPVPRGLVGRLGSRASSLAAARVSSSVGGQLAAAVAAALRRARLRLNEARRATLVP